MDHIIYANGSGSSRVILYLIAVGLDWPDKLTQRLCPLSRLNGHVLAVLSELTITDYAAINLTHTLFLQLAVTISTPPTANRYQAIAPLH